MEKKEWRFHVSWNDFPGHEWSDVFSDEADIRKKIAETFCFKGFGWYSVPGTNEVSLLLPAPNGRIYFHHFSVDPRNFTYVCDVPDLCHPDRGNPIQSLDVDCDGDFNGS